LLEEMLATHIYILLLLSPIGFVYTQAGCICGVSNSPGLNVCDTALNLKVIGGGEAEINEFPWTALLEIKESSTGPLQRCGGTLISDRFRCS
jgi:hypothetical protein